ncbi:MAG TPA: chromate transporter [Geomonas sp.]|nr:chromate transporter [Geomonas sp.]
MQREVKHVSLGEIARTFFEIGATGFGGGMAVVAVVERRCVHDKKWLGHDEFMHGLAFGQVLGPYSLNICTFVGSYLRGLPGGVVATACFLTPSFLLVTLLSLLYFHFHELPELKAALIGSNPIVISLVLVAGIGMARRKAAQLPTAIIALAAFAASAFYGASALSVLMAAGCVGLVKGWYAGRRRP